MVTYIIRRVLVVALVLAFFIPATFFLIQAIPGGPYDTAFGGGPPTFRERLEADYGLAKRPVEQFFYYVHTLLRGDLGPLAVTPSRDVNDMVAETLPVSLQLSALSLVVGFGVGVPLGTMTALRHYGWAGRIIRRSTLVLVSLPNMVLGPLLLFISWVSMRWVPFPLGWGADYPYVLGVLPHWPELVGPEATFISQAVLPVLTLGLWFAAAIARHTHPIMLDLLQSPYIRTAQAKGLRQRAILRGHVGKNYLLKVVRLSRRLLTHLFVGLLITENIFAINGLGRYLVASIYQREYFLLLNGLLVVAVLILLAELVVDIAAAWLSPTPITHTHTPIIHFRAGSLPLSPGNQQVESL